MTTIPYNPQQEPAYLTRDMLEEKDVADDISMDAEPKYLDLSSTLQTQQTLVQPQQQLKAVLPQVSSNAFSAWRNIWVFCQALQK